MPGEENLDFEDGDIILSLPERKFRVHKAILAEKSGVFADMVTMPAPPDQSPTSTSADLPIVPLYDDDEELFTMLLHIFYEHNLESYFPPRFDKQSKETLSLIFRIMGLADKYNATSSAASGLASLLERDWPVSLIEWDKNEARSRELHAELEANRDVETFLDDLVPEPCIVIRFAHMYKVKDEKVQLVPSFIPAAFYHLSRLPAFADPDDITCNVDDLVDGVRRAKRALLSNRDMKCLLHGIWVLRNWASGIALHGFIEEVEKYTGPEQEGETQQMLEWWREKGLELLVGQDRADVLNSLRILAEALSDDDTDEEEVVSIRLLGSATPFKQAMESYLRKEREVIWSTLVETFHLYAFFYDD